LAHGEENDRFTLFNIKDRSKRNMKKCQMIFMHSLILEYKRLVINSYLLKELVNNIIFVCNYYIFKIIFK